MDVKSKQPNPQLLSADWQPQHQVAGGAQMFASKSVSPLVNDRSSSYLDLSKVEDKSPLPQSGKLLRRGSFAKLSDPPPEATPSALPKAIMPPKHLEEREYAELCHLLCDRMTDPHARLSIRQLSRFCEQAIKDLKYLRSLAKKGIENQDKIPAGIRKTVVAKLLGQQKSYDTLIETFNDCLKTFKKGTTVKTEYNVYHSIDFPDQPWVLITTQTDMLIEMKKNWKMLIRFMEQWRSVMPAPAQFCDNYRTMTPDQMTSLATIQENDPVPFYDRVRELLRCAKQLQAGWKVLEANTINGKISKFTRPVEEDQHHAVKLPQEVNPLPPLHDLTNVFGDPEKTAPAPFRCTWCISGRSDNSELPTHKKYFSSEKEAKTNREKLLMAAKKSKPQRGVLAESLTVSQSAIVLFEPKPEDYFKYQPVAEGTLNQVQQKGLLRINQALPSLEALCKQLKAGKILRGDENERYSEICTLVEQSLALWNKHIPSLQSTLDSIYLSDRKALLARQAKEKFRQLHLPAGTPITKLLERRATDQELSPRTTARRLINKLSLPDVQFPGPQLTIALIPPTPSPSASLSSGSPGFYASSPTDSPAHMSPVPPDSQNETELDHLDLPPRA